MNEVRAIHCGYGLGGDGGDQAGLAPLLGSHGIFSVTDELKFGISVFSFSGEDVRVKIPGIERGPKR